MLSPRLGQVGEADELAIFMRTEGELNHKRELCICRCLQLKLLLPLHFDAATVIVAVAARLFLPECDHNTNDI